MNAHGKSLRTPAVALGVAGAAQTCDAARNAVASLARAAITSRLAGAVLVCAVCAGLWQVGHSLYIHAKARLAQYLIADAWQQTLAGKRAVKPWPWADTWPVARLVAPAADEDLYVLAGANGRTIAFGPGHMYGTPLPGMAGNSVIGGHRDTHFTFLRRLQPGNALAVQREDGVTTRYQVTYSAVVDKAEIAVARDHGDTRLTLVTCWPFDALRAGGRERYVVTAVSTTPSATARLMR